MQTVRPSAIFDDFEFRKDVKYMRRLLTIFGALALFSALALAESWTGQLLDASCYDQNKTAKGCDATGSSSTFAIAVSGKVYRLDDTGNSKAGEAIRNRANRSADPNQPAAATVNAKVNGKLEGETLKVDTIEIM
jgi:hypothetical protein